MTRVRLPRDEGFTLVELLIAIVIIGITVSVMVLAMSTLVVATEEQRGHAVSDNNARSFAEAMQQKVSFKTTLTAAVSASGAATLSLADPVAGFQTSPVSSSSTFDVLVDQEIMTVTAASGSTLT